MGSGIPKAKARKAQKAQAKAHGDIKVKVAGPLTDDRAPAKERAAKADSVAAAARDSPDDADTSTTLAVRLAPKSPEIRGIDSDATPTAGNSEGGPSDGNTDENGEWEWQDGYDYEPNSETGYDYDGWGSNEWDYSEDGW